MRGSRVLSNPVTYGEHWTAFLGEEFTCQQEIGNVLDRYAIAVKKDTSKTVGHVLEDF